MSHIFATVWIPIFDKRKGSDSFSTIWIPIFDKRKGSYIFSTVWILIFDERKDEGGKGGGGGVWITNHEK